MKLTVQQVFDATIVVDHIIRSQRKLPQKGKYRLARLHAKLAPEFKLLNERRDEMIKAYDYHPPVADGQPAAADAYAVPADKMAEFAAAWADIAKEVIEVDVEPVPLAQLDLGDDVDGAIEVHELVALGDLVVE
ncbi:MAG: hypothetical protein ACP5QR_05210 [Rhizomicrobium sp.]